MCIACTVIQRRIEFYSEIPRMSNVCRISSEIILLFISEEIKNNHLSPSLFATSLCYSPYHMVLCANSNLSVNFFLFTGCCMMCGDSSTPPPFLLYHPFVKCEGNLPFTTNKESGALIAKSTLFPPPLLCHLKCALCLRVGRGQKNCFLSDTRASELLRDTLE